ncbi:MAG: class I SAM-dependent methyltransferase [Sphingobacteriales bacterium]|nr:class I SAM-dependent methyltransferase [Sphingobacteriales bacterium]
MKITEILQQTDHYYTAKLQAHGTTPQGADWNGAASQELRFAVLAQLFDAQKSNFSVLDYGCGYGAFWEWLQRQTYTDIIYSGYDISAAMLQTAQEQYPALAFSRQIPETAADFVVASGVWNVKQQQNTTQWEQYICDELAQLQRLSKRGFAFNLLTAYSDPPKQRDYLYYASPTFWFDYCKRHFSARVALLHDYPLYEFTILVRK